MVRADQAADAVTTARVQIGAAPYHANSVVEGAEVRRYCPLDSAATNLLRAASAKGQLSARVIDRIAHVARTIADLAGTKIISDVHVAEAIGYRSLECRGLAA